MVIKKIRIPTCQEWDHLVAVTNGDNDAMHWREIFSWCADDIEASRTCVIRGYYSPAIGIAETPCFEHPAPASAPPLRMTTPTASLMVCLCWLVLCIWTGILFGQTTLMPAMSRATSPGPRWKLDLRSTTRRTGFGLSKPAESSSQTGICCGTSPARTSANRDSAKGGTPMIFYIADWHYNRQ